jgi:hypothetical protein
MFLGWDVSPWAVVAALWVALHLYGLLTRTRTPPGPPGGRVLAVHDDAEWADAQRDAKETGKLVRAAARTAPATPHP